jgi:hypothetical protein
MNMATAFREKILRSVNIQYDAAHPERIAHFRPTGKAVQLVNALSGNTEERAFFIVAPYGSGKSLTATYVLQLVENRENAQQILQTVEGRISLLSPSIREFSESRRLNTEKGLAITLEGYCESLHLSIQDSIMAALERNNLPKGLMKWVKKAQCSNISEAIVMLKGLIDKLEEQGMDRVVLLWDEFGRHLESLLERGYTAELNQIQQLAEFSSRSNTLPFVMGLLLHQQLLQYAGSLSQSNAAEWKKIEGRFEAIHYIDDSAELYRLLGELVNDYHQGCSLTKEQLGQHVQSCRELGLFADFAEDDSLANLFEKAYPLEPTTLFLLPKVAARVAQNERTLFTFLQSLDFSKEITLVDLYDYFSPAMQADTTIGGTYRRWIETESALSKLLEEPEAEAALKMACLLSLGIHGERKRTGKGLLEYTLQGYRTVDSANRIIESLIERKLLLHRKHSDEVAIWHGTDIDLRGRLNEEMQRHPIEELDLVTFLNNEAKPPTWRPVKYNSQYSINRFFAGNYADMAMLVENLQLFQDRETEEERFGDGFIWYVIATTEDELREAELCAKDQKNRPNRLIVLPKHPTPLARAALEVQCLTKLQHDENLLSQDPLVATELLHMLDDARNHLQKWVERLIWPGSIEARWFYQGEEQDISSPSELRKFLSSIMDDVYNQTPVICNENIVRNHPTRNMVNARKKVLMGILERYGQENLGLVGFQPDASMFRTVLLHTKLYRKSKKGVWSFCLPEKIRGDKGLRSIWRMFQDFFTVPNSEPKDVDKFMSSLIEPPYGLRKGLVPIFFAAAFQAFPSTLSLLKDGEYVDDLLPSDIELLCREPKRFDFLVLERGPNTLPYLQTIYRCFSDKNVDWNLCDLIRVSHDAIEEWKARLPEASFQTNQLSQEAMNLRKALRRTKNPVTLLFHEIPRICHIPPRTPGEPFTEEEIETLQIFSEAVDELEGVASKYRAEAASELIPLFTSNPTGNLREVAQAWRNNFPAEFMDSLKPSPEKNLLSRINMNYNDDGKLVESIAGLLLRRATKHWDDTSVRELVRATQNVILRVEEDAFKCNATQPQDEESKEKLGFLMRERMTDLLTRMADVLGKEQTKEEVLRLLDDLSKE